MRRIVTRGGRRWLVDERGWRALDPIEPPGETTPVRLRVDPLPEHYQRRREPEPQPAPTPRVVPRDRGRDLARRLRAEGISSARWVRQPDGDWGISTFDDEADAALAALDRLADHDRRNR